MSEAPHIPTSRKLKWLKLFRYARTYGWKRALVKALGRTRSQVQLNGIARRDVTRRIGIIGCGQFAYATICYFLREELNPLFTGVFDTDREHARSLAQQYGADFIYDNAEQLLTDVATDVIYIASDHASHAAYAVRALQAGKKVYVEKPLATTREDFALLEETARAHPGSIVAGYNRPYAPAVRELRRLVATGQDPFTLQCFIHTHVLPAGHWYRDPRQGTRICGNMGHWLDLAIHLLYARSVLPSRISIALNWASDTERDDNLSVVLATDLQDLITITLTARHEPFEGVRERISFQDVHREATIDDFRKMTVTTGTRTQRYAYRPKDPGHRKAVLQPFLLPVEVRNWEEVMQSTRLMLDIADMVRTGDRTGHFDLFPERS